MMRSPVRRYGSQWLLAVRGIRIIASYMAYAQTACHSLYLTPPSARAVPDFASL